MEHNNKKVITGKMMAKWLTILGFSLFAISWLVVSLRESVLVPEFVREQWYLWLIIFLPTVIIGLTDEKGGKI